MLKINLDENTKYDVKQLHLCTVWSINSFIKACSWNAMVTINKTLSTFSIIAQHAKLKSSIRNEWNSGIPIHKQLSCICS